MKISEKIKKLRIEQKMTQEKFAKSIGITQKTLSFWEQGVNEPKEENILTICNKYNIEKEYFEENNVMDFEKNELLLQIQETFGISTDHLDVVEVVLTSKNTRSLIKILIKALHGDKESAEALIGILKVPEIAKTFIE